MEYIGTTKYSVPLVLGTIYYSLGTIQIPMGNDVSHSFNVSDDFVDIEVNRGYEFYNLVAQEIVYLPAVIGSRYSKPIETWVDAYLIDDNKYRE